MHPPMRVFLINGILPLIGVILFPQFSYTQSIYWRQMDGPSGGTVQSFASYGDNIFASVTSCGYIYWSCDQGRSWRIINSNNNPLSSVATNASTIFALGSYQTLVSSTDLGQTWKSVYIQIPGYPQLTQLWSFENRLYLGNCQWILYLCRWGKDMVIAMLSYQAILAVEQKGKYLIVGTNNGVYSSDDSGATFDFSYIGNITTLQIQNSQVFAGNGYGDVYLSTDQGTNWTWKGNTGGGILLSLLAKDSLLIAGTQSDGIKISTDYGITWTNTNMYFQYVYSLFDHGDVVLAGTRYDGMYISTDEGESWRATSTSSMNIEAIASFDSVLLVSQEYCSNIYRSEDAGKTWTTIHLPTDFVFDFANAGSVYFVSTDNGVFISTDKGFSWKPGRSQLNNDNVFAITYFNGLLFAGTAGGKLYESSDDGLTWNVSPNFPVAEVYDLMGLGSRIYAATLYGIYVSSNQGLSWEKHSPDGFVNDLGLEDSVIFASGSFNNNNSGYDYEVIKSTDNGQSWIAVMNATETQGTYFYGFAAHGHDLYLGTNKGVFLTSDLGNNWIPFSDSLQNGGECVTHLATDGENLYAGANPCGIWWRPYEAAYLNYSHQPIEFDNVAIGSTAEADMLLENSGNLPLMIQSATLSNQNFSLQLTSRNIAPGSSSNIKIRFTPSQLGEQEAELVFRSNAFNSLDSVEILGLSRKKNGLQTLPGIPVTFHLENNYPNPFNSTTTILFGIPVPGHVRLKIYDIKGSAVATLLDEDFPAGNFEYHWNATGVASGNLSSAVSIIIVYSDKKDVILEIACLPN